MGLLFFKMPACQPCNAMLPSVVKVAKSRGIELQVIFSDIESNADLLKKYMVAGVPLLIAVDGSGEQIARLNGFNTEDKILEWLDEEVQGAAV